MNSGIHNAQLLECYIDKPEYITMNKINECIKDFDSLEIYYQICINLFDQTSFAYENAAVSKL